MQLPTAHRKQHELITVSTNIPEWEAISSLGQYVNFNVAVQEAVATKCSHHQHFHDSPPRCEGENLFAWEIEH